MVEISKKKKIVDQDYFESLKDDLLRIRENARPKNDIGR